jgi:hypothetical protein
MTKKPKELILKSAIPEVIAYIDDHWNEVECPEGGYCDIKELHVHIWWPDKKLKTRSLILFKKEV